LGSYVQGISANKLFKRVRGADQFEEETFKT